jgi:hypothetical protein
VVKFTGLRVTGFSRRYFDLDWEIAPTHDDLQEWEFFVERSEAEAGPWIVIAGPIIDRYYMRDNTTPQISVNRTLFYRVRAVNQSRGLDTISPTADREGEPDLIAAEIASLEHLLFTEFTGTRTWLFVRRTFGQRCPQCWDDVLAKSVDDSCPTCFRTGFSGGYHYPIEFFAQFDKAPQSENVSAFDHHQLSPVTFRCTGSPKISPMDLIIDHKNQRLRIITVSHTSRLGVGVHQEIQAVQLQPGSIEDAIELKVEHRELTLTASRNYTNPQNLEAAGVSGPSELDGLLGRYGYRDNA